MPLAGGTGTELDPYLISTAEQLYNIRQGGQYPGANNTYYRQINDIIISSELGNIWCDGTDEDKTYCFKEYDGGKFKVHLEYYSIAEIGVGTLSAGLFPILADGSLTIKDLGVQCNLQARGYVGGLVGRSGTGLGYKYIKNCYSRGSVKGLAHVGGLIGSLRYGSINKCYSEAIITGSQNLGGILGAGNSVDITECYNIGDVFCVEGGNVLFHAGGITGSLSYSTIVDCYNLGNIHGQRFVGGITGEVDYSIGNCYNLGDVSGISKVGGIAGEYFNRSNTYFKNCFALNDKIIEVSEDEDGDSNSFGRIIGMQYTTGPQPYNCHAINTMEFFPFGGAPTTVFPDFNPVSNGKDGIDITSSQAKIQSNYNGWDFSGIWRISQSINDGYPYLLWTQPEGESKIFAITNTGLKRAKKMYTITETGLKEIKKLNVITDEGLK